MPPVIGQPTAIGTLPYSLSTKFTEAHSVPMNMNQYHDLTSQRVALVTGGRRSWQISKRLDPSSVSLLRQFCYAAKGGAFYFYNPSETNPPYSNNPSGTAGRYLVRFASDWSQTTGMSRSDTSIELIEVSEIGAIDIGAPIVPGSGPGAGGNDGGGGTTPPPPTLVFSVVAPDPVGAAPLSRDKPHFSYGPISYNGYLWAYGIPGNDPRVGGVFVAPSAGVYKSSDGIAWTVQDPRFDVVGWPNTAYWDGGSMLTFVIVRGNGNVKLVDFDMSTGTYGATSPIIVLDNPTSNLWQTNLFKLSNGTFRLLYEHVESGTSPVYLADYASGSWSSPTAIVSGAYYTLASANQDGDVIHTFYSVRGAGRATSDDGLLHETGYHYVQVAADGTISTPVALDTILAADGSGQWYMNTGIVSGNSILIPAAREFTNFTTPTNIGVLVGTPKSNPTFTYVPVGSVASLRGPLDMKMLRLGTKDYLAWSQTNTTTINDSLIYISSSTNGGTTWSTPALLLDLDATPLPIAVDESPELDISSFSLGDPIGAETIGLMFTSRWTYWTNAPALLP